MKHIYLSLLLFCGTLLAQDYHKNWEKVLKLESQGKIKSADAKVTRIYEKAKRDNNGPQLVKCFFYSAKYSHTLEPKSAYKIIRRLKEQAASSPSPTRSLFYLIYGKCLSNFRHRNSRVISTTDLPIDQNPELWSFQNISDEIDRAYTESLRDSTALKNTPISGYDQIFDYLSKDKFNSQTLLDFALSENIAHYSSTTYFAEPIRRFINDHSRAALLGNSPLFTIARFDTVSYASDRKVLELMQRRERLRPDVSNRLDRVSWIFRHDSDSKIGALLDLQGQTSDTIERNDVRYELASVYKTQADNERKKDGLTKAVSLLDSIIATGKRSNSYRNAISARTAILSKQLELHHQRTLYEGENARALVTFTNLDTLAVAIYRAHSDLQFWRRYDSKKFDVAGAVKDRKPLVYKTYRLPDPGDHFHHSTEILLPNLPLGTYIVRVTADDNGTPLESFSVLTVSNLAYLKLSDNEQNSYSIVHRKTGRPITNATVQIDQRMEYRLGDAEGTFRLRSPKGSGEKNCSGYISVKNDTLAFHQVLYAHQKRESETLSKAEILLDRAIYRPGQTVFFKVIAMQKDSVKTAVVEKVRFEVAVYDTNHKEIFKKIDQTNAFGSFSGEFQLPTAANTGIFFVYVRKPTSDLDLTASEMSFWKEDRFIAASGDFKVEEYKRPKFEVTFAPAKEPIKLNGYATVEGLGKALTGSSISNARVKYTVTLVSIAYRSDDEFAYDKSEDVDEIILTDSTNTDEKGRFTISFPTAYYEFEDEEDRERQPVYKYQVKADLTDCNGETRTAETTVMAGDHTLQLGFNAVLTRSRRNKIELTSTDLNGTFKPVVGQLTFRQIRMAPFHFKRNPFAAPEIPGFTAAEFRKLFPNEVYENDMFVGLDSATVKTVAVNTGKRREIEVDLSALATGQYEVVFSGRDENGNLIKNVVKMPLTDPAARIDPSRLISLKVTNENPQKDGYASIRVTSFVKDLDFKIVSNNGEIIFFSESRRLENNEAVVKIPIEKGLGPVIAVSAATFYDNSFQTANLSVAIPEPESSLELETVSYRNLIEPGSNQNWSFKLKAKNTTLESEVLASMYDFSLDTFVKREWRSPSIPQWRYPTVKQYWANDPEIENLSLRKYFNSVFGISRPEKTQLIWFGFDINNQKTPIIEKLYKEQITAKAQKPIGSRFVSGCVSDASGPLPGANVIVNGTHRGVQTDADGYYQIEAADEETLVFSFIGMEDLSVLVEQNKIINAHLVEGGIALGEVIVSGAMGIQKKMNATTGTNSVILGDEMPSSVMALVGKVSGVQINTDSTETGVTRVVLRGNRSVAAANEVLIVVDGQILSTADFNALNPEDILNMEVFKGAQGAALYGAKGANGVLIVTTKKTIDALSAVKARTNFSETAFFLPHLTTDKNGNINFSFTSPEALTSWKLRLLAHNKNGVSTQLHQKVSTQKKLMAIPNMPRFFRQGDSIRLSAKITSIDAKPMKGSAMLELYDAATMQSADVECANLSKVKTFAIAPMGTVSVEWKITVPSELSGLHYRIVARSEDFSDGEENTIPVLANSLLITESKPIWLKGRDSQTIAFENLASDVSETRRHHKITVELASNPVWFALEALPYLMEYEHECAEQTFARYYANTIAGSIIESNPKVKEVVAKWKQSGNGKLEQNDDLKSILANETPWFRDALSESERKKRLGLLFDLDKMRASQKAVLEKLRERQLPSGGFAWFDGSQEDEYITRHIVAGLGHIKRLGLSQQQENFMEVAKRAVAYLDDSFLRRHSSPDIAQHWKMNFSPDLHFLYARSFFTDEIPLKPATSAEIENGLNAVVGQQLKLSIYEKAMAALVLNRFGRTKAARALIDQLSETSATDKSNGLYWTENTAGWHWYQSPVETQSLLIEAFSEVVNDKKSVDAMKAWLIKNKQTSHWPTTKATTEAVYALFMQGSDWSNAKSDVSISIGDQNAVSRKLAEIDSESEAGYVKLNWNASEISDKMGTLRLHNKTDIPAFGGFYWQYFEDSDKVKATKGPMSVRQEVFRKANGASDASLVAVSPSHPFSIGELVTVRITFTATDDLEYVHLKSMRASCFEPVDVLSGYQSRGGIWFYKSTKDAATHFFFSQLKAGSYTLEYDVRVNNAGDFSNGITTLQSMYAPEFSAHSKGIRIKTK
ncbi:alpha-2-macroglobulin family protein [Flavobacterium selenitireducens]|uniref:alpha-2-macroglobulin family protein n=1 Tax=Flavobacterium selenitireducens TaxID=2722704 RepID=UPI00168B283E|nr:carboxypeptidase-like regulatory domain-containing protein [Flavobacterium selenitireducens]MBD3583988.1 TonB-dependent receptor plug domain-containing protein [Flavobacterium selenitireducens]